MVTWLVCPGEEPIAAYAAGRLPRKERDAIDAHLDTCSSCSEVVATLAKLASSGAMPASTIGDRVDEAERLLEGHLGRYVLLSRIGEGGLGVVYSAYDPELDRRVALKILRRSGDGIRDEARNIAKLAHPNVVAVHDVGRVDDTSFVAMEFVDGVTLRTWLAESRTEHQILDAFVQAGRGLAAAHAVGLVHRDVKPSNIMIGADGRARVLDFGLAGGAGAAVGGTPAYMAPEQARGEAVDARADQYAFCVALWEALAGERPTAKPSAVGMLVYTAEPIVKALRRGLAVEPAARFGSMDELLAQLVPPPSRRHLPWLSAAIVALLIALGMVVVAGRAEQNNCGKQNVWGDAERAAMRAHPMLVDQLDRWAARWTVGAEAVCADDAEPQPLRALRQACLDQALAQLRPIVAVAMSEDATVIEHADQLVPSIAAPERCDDVAVLGAVVPPPESSRAEVAAVRETIDELEAQLIAGRDVGEKVAALRIRAENTGYGPSRARAAFLVAQFDNARTKFARAIVELHAAAQLATSARDQELLAEIWIELVKSLGNDPRSLDQSDLFDGYVSALIPQLPDREQLTEQLAQARCTRNISGAAQAMVAIGACQYAIALAERAQLFAVANAERARLGHFQRMAGKTAESLATLHLAVTDAERIFGPNHPDTAIAHYALGIAEISAGQDGLAELQQSLEIRRAVYPNGSAAVAESLQGLGDALGAAGNHAEAVPLLEEGLGMLARLHLGESAEAANMHLLAGMSLEQLKRNPEAIAHDLRGADIADKSLEHREELAAMGLRMAANLEPDHAVGKEHAERALRLLERGHASVAAIGKTQLVIAELESDPTRARAMAMTAKQNLVAAGPAGAEDLAELDQWLKSSR
jgi:hypothetical protein